MAEVTSTWLVGSVLYNAAQDITIDGTGYQVAAGTWYLRSATPAESLLSAILTLMTTEGLAGASVTITERRTVVIAATPTFAIVWSDVTLRDALGFSGNLSGANSYEATYPSPLLWSGGFPASRSVPDGHHGRPVEDVRTEFSRDGTEVRQIFHHTQRWDELQWANVMRARTWYDPAGSEASWGGTWERFRERVFLLNRRFKLYELVQENTASATAVTWPAEVGQYRARVVPPGAPTRAVPNANTRWNPTVEVIRG